MVSHPRTIALICGRLERSRVADAARELVTLEFVDSVQHLEFAVLRSAPAVSIVIAEPFDKAHTLTAPMIGRLVRVRPEVCVLGYLSRGSAGDFPDLARAGVHDLVFRGEDAEPELKKCLSRALRRVARGTLYGEERNGVAARGCALGRHRCVS